MAKKRKDDFSLKTLFLGMALGYAGILTAYGLVSNALPTPEDYAKAKGYNTDEIAKLSAGRNVRIHHLTETWELIHAAFTHGDIDFEALNNPAAYPDPKLLLLSPSRLLTGEVMYITVPDYDFIMKNEVCALLNLDEKWIPFDPLTPEEGSALRLRHDVAHTTREGLELLEAKTFMVLEGRMDIRAVETSAPLSMEKNRTALTHFRALHLSSEHDDSLYLNAYNNNQALPSDEQILNTTNTLLYKVKKIWGPYKGNLGSNHELRMPNKSDPPLRLADFVVRLETLLAREDELTDLERQRAELFLGALDYFLPSFRKQAALLLMDHRNRSNRYPERDYGNAAPN